MDGIKEKFESFYPGRTPERLYSAPGRTEICGNHTDHQHGKVLAAAVELLSRAAVLPNNSGVIRVKSEGYDYFEIDLSELSPVTAERGTTAALVRGVAAGCSTAEGRAVCMEEALRGRYRRSYRTICLKTSRQVSSHTSEPAAAISSPSAARAARGSASRKKAQTNKKHRDGS